MIEEKIMAQTMTHDPLTACWFRRAAALTVVFVVVPLKFQVTLTVLLVVWTIIPMPNPGSVKVKSRVDDWPLKPLGFLYVNFENFRKLQTH